MIQPASRSPVHHHHLRSGAERNWNSLSWCSNFSYPWRCRRILALPRRIPKIQASWPLRWTGQQGLTCLILRFGTQCILYVLFPTFPIFFWGQLLTLLQAFASIGRSLGFKLLANASACIPQHVLIISVDTSSVPTPFQLIRQRFVLILSAIQFAAQHYFF
jgi:hypothetical protein